MKKAFAVSVFMVLLSVVAIAATRHDNVIFVIDDSQSVSEKGLFEEARGIVARMNERFPGYVRSAGILEFGPRRSTVSWESPVAQWDRDKFAETVKKLPEWSSDSPLTLALAEVKGKLSGVWARPRWSSCPTANRPTSFR